MPVSAEVREMSVAASRWQRMAPPVTSLAGLALTGLALRLRDPHEPGSWGVCPSYALFGVYCPGCGGLRSVNDLTHLDLGAAVSSNLLFVAFLPLIGWVFARTLLAAWRGESYLPRTLETSRFYLVLTGLMVVFMIVRNLPQGGWLAP